MLGVVQYKYHQVFMRFIKCNSSILGENQDVIAKWMWFRDKSSNKFQSHLNQQRTWLESEVS